MYESLAILVAFVLIYSLICGGLEKTPVNGATLDVGFKDTIGELVIHDLFLRVQ